MHRREYVIEDRIVGYVYDHGVRRGVLVCTTEYDEALDPHTSTPGKSQCSTPSRSFPDAFGLGPW